jgi:hypothetical protein
MRCAGTDPGSVIGAHNGRYLRGEQEAFALSASRYPVFRPDERSTGMHNYASRPCAKTSAHAACSALSRRRRPTVTQFPVTRCQICQRTVACRPGALSQTLTDDYRRVHPERWASPPSNTRITRPGEGRTRSCP